MQQNYQIVVMKSNENIIVAETGICWKLEYHFLNTSLKQNKYFIISACLWREKKITS